MTDVRLLSQLARRNPVRWGGIEGFRLTRRALLAAGAAASAGAMLGRPSMAQDGS